MLKHKVSEIYRNNTTTIIGVFALNIDALQFISTGAYYAFIEPVAVVICQGGKNKAVNMQSQRISINQLCQLAPELQQYI
jgi:uncharacterized membrane protein YcaP (DUF421 family)